MDTLIPLAPSTRRLPQHIQDSLQNYLESHVSTLDVSLLTGGSLMARLIHPYNSEPLTRTMRWADSLDPVTVAKIDAAETCVRDLLYPAPQTGTASQDVMTAVSILKRYLQDALHPGESVTCGDRPGVAPDSEVSRWNPLQTGPETADWHREEAEAIRRSQAAQACSGNKNDDLAAVSSTHGSANKLCQGQIKKSINQIDTDLTTLASMDAWGAKDSQLPIRWDFTFLSKTQKMHPRLSVVWGKSGSLDPRDMVPLDARGFYSGTRWRASNPVAML